MGCSPSGGDMGNVRGWRKAAVCWVAALSVTASWAAGPMTPAQAVNEGKTLGKSKISSTAVDETLRSKAVPAAPPPRDCTPDLDSTKAAYGGGNGNLLGAALPVLGSAAGGTSQECNAIAYMQGKSAAPNPISIHPSDPLLVKGNQIQASPDVGLGSFGGVFIDRPAAPACQPGTVTVGGNATQEQCYEFAEINSGTCDRPVEFEIEKWWDYQCTKTVGGTTDQICEQHWEVEVAPGPGGCVEGQPMGKITIPFVQRPGYSDWVGGGEVEMICRAALVGTGTYAARFRTTPTGVSTTGASTDLSNEPWEPEKIVSGSGGFTLRTFPQNITIAINGLSCVSTDPLSCTAVVLQVYTVSYTGGILNKINLNFGYSNAQPVITRDELVTDCGVYSSNPSCTAAGSVCLEGVNETRVINGLSVTKDCWRSALTYQCSGVATGGTCGPLQAEPLCTQTTAGDCTQFSMTGECLARTPQYRCTKDMGPPNGVTLLGTGYKVIKDVINESACDARKANPNCTKVSSTCVDTADKVIDGFTFSKACWKWQDTYSCAEMPGQQSCSTLEAQGCTPIAGSRACSTLLPDGSCGVYTTMYQCGTPAQTLDTGSTCDTTPYCINGICYDQARPGDPDFGKSVAMMEVGRQGGVYLEQNELTVFNGVASFCRRKLFGANNCCKPDSGGSTNWTNQAAHSAMKFGINYIGSYNVYDMLFAGETDFIVQAAFGMGEYNTGTTTSIYGFEFSIVNGDITFIGFDPWSFAIQVAIQIVIQELTSCPDSDKLTATRRGQGLCGFVGDYCASKVLGSCYTVKEGYCCFNSKLAKAVTMQGKPQLGKSLGDGRNPDCKGLTADEISTLDFSKIDLSEFIADLVTNPIGEGQATSSVVSRLASYAPVAPDYAKAPSVAAGYTQPPPKPPAPPTPPDPDATAVFAPNPVRHGQPFALTTTTTNADSLEYDCTGFMPMAGNIPVGNQVTTFTAPTSGTGQTDCMIKVVNKGADITTQVSFTVLPPAPAVSVAFTPSSVLGGDSFMVSYAVTNADKLSYSCSGGMVIAGDLPAGGSSAGPWTAPLSDGLTLCVFSAKNTQTNEVATAQATLSVAERLPTIAASFSMAPAKAGQSTSLNTNISWASSATLTCTGALPVSQALSLPTSSVVFNPTLANIGTAVCTITALSATGQAVNSTISLVINP